MMQVTDANENSRCTWAMHTFDSNSNRSIIKMEDRSITLCSYCEVGKERAYNYLHDEVGKHVLNDQVSFTLLSPP